MDGRCFGQPFLRKHRRPWRRARWFSWGSSASSTLTTSVREPTDKEQGKEISSMNNSLILRILFAAWLLAVSAPLNAQVGRHQGMIEPNVGDEKELAKLPPLNPELVKGIVERRPFANMLELHKFLSASLDSKQLNELYSKMFIQMNLNTAPRAEIMLIPGMGNRMVREFLEYRPYTAMAQFRKEIGKYVDEKEVARW